MARVGVVFRRLKYEGNPVFFHFRGHAALVVAAFKFGHDIAKFRNFPFGNPKGALADSTNENALLLQLVTNNAVMINSRFYYMNPTYRL